LKEHIAEYLEAPEGSSLATNKMPFTDAELQRIYAACDALGGPTALAQVTGTGAAKTRSTSS
jgi:hypothetical protein